MENGFSDPPRKFEGRKRTIEVSIDAELLAEAEARNIDLTGVLEHALRMELAKEERIRKLQEETREEAQFYNRYIAEHGAMGDKRRTW